MLKTKKNQLIALIVSSVVFIAILFQFHLSPNVPKAGASGFTYYNSGTNTAILCKSGTSTLISTSTPARVYVRLSDVSAVTGGTGEAYINLGTSAATGTGIYLNATSSTWEMGQNELVYAGPIYCLADNGNATITVSTLP